MGDACAVEFVLLRESTAYCAPVGQCKQSAASPSMVRSVAYCDTLYFRSACLYEMLASVASPDSVVSVVPAWKCRAVNSPRPGVELGVVSELAERVDGFTVSHRSHWPPFSRCHMSRVEEECLLARTICHVSGSSSGFMGECGVVVLMGQYAIVEWWTSLSCRGEGVVALSWGGMCAWWAGPMLTVFVVSFWSGYSSVGLCGVVRGEETVVLVEPCIVGGSGSSWCWGCGCAVLVVWGVAWLFVPSFACVSGGLFGMCVRW